MAQMIAASSYTGNSPYMSESDYRKCKKANIKSVAEINRKRFGENHYQSSLSRGTR